MKPKVAFIGTGGTISSLGSGPLDILDYGASENRMQADAIAAMFPQWAEVAEVIPVNFENVVSHNIYFDVWKRLALLCERVVAENPGLAGIVIGHGTASMEETAYFLNLVLKVDVPVVIVGSQRPASSLSTDAGMNLVNAVRTACSPAARGMGVMLLLNDEIHAAREVTKTSTFRLQTFRTPDFGVLGHADGDKVVFYRAPLRRRMPDTEFDIRGLDGLPRVDIVYSYVGADATAARAFIAAGAKGIVSAGFAPGSPGTEEAAVLAAAVKEGLVVVQSTRAGSGRTFRGKRAREQGFLVADNLNPQKARLLLALALTVTNDPADITRIFETY
ncbi:asparaginase [Acidisphaera sp. L21]|uniref:asparaginase n=1 Tax=Acidisphaera sp. L21 TaxID=1641851 RepID=UPI00131ADD21|nr:asparaginase [Acidisphaera sp. L21]